VLLATLGHVVTVVLGVVVALQPSGPDWLLVWVLGQAGLFIVTVIAGTILLVSGDRGVGLGVFIGWGGGLVLTVIITIAVILILLDTSGVG
jgi:hypothetical protein